MRSILLAPFSHKPPRMRLDGLAHDVRHALRALRQRPGFAVVALLILALGISAATVMFTVVDGVLLRRLPFKEPDRLVALRVSTQDVGEVWGYSYPDIQDLIRSSRTMDIAAWSYSGGTITDNTQAEWLDGRILSASLLPVLGVTPEQGRGFRADEDRPGGTPVAMISDAFWRRHFDASPAAIGAPLTYNGVTYTIVGVVPAELQMLGPADVFTPLGQFTEVRMGNRGARFIHALGRLRPGVTIARARGELAVTGRQLAAQYPATDAGASLVARPLRDEVVGDIGSTLWLLLGAVSVVLLIACVNIASLLLARAAARDHELALRTALGASRARVAQQSVTESAILGLAGGALGALLAAAGVRPFVALWPGGLPRGDEIRLDWRVLLFAFVVSLTTGLLAGLAPALRASARDLGTPLRASGRGTTRNTRRTHGAFVVAELALAIVLLISAGMLGRTLVAQSARDPGLDPHHVLVAHFALSPDMLADPRQMRAAWRRVIDRAGATPGVRSVALSDIIPMREGENNLSYSTTPTESLPDQMPVALASTVTPAYREVMRIPLLKGRFIAQGDSLGAEPVIVIDANLARHAFGDADPVGRRLWVPAFGSNPVRIVGVVGHVRQWGMANDDISRVHDEIYSPFAQVPPSHMRLFSGFMSIAVRTTAAPGDMIRPLQAALRGAAADQAMYDIQTMDQVVHASLDQQRFLLLLFGIFAGVAMLLACAGIYGVLSYLTTQRVPEIGVRLALGATAGDVIRFILQDSIRLIACGTILGLGAALLADRVLLKVVVGMRPTEPATVAAMLALLVTAALAASFLPARWASRIDPVQALRGE
jgi:predicted permease